jgi:hypothetical protein
LIIWDALASAKLIAAALNLALMAFLFSKSYLSCSSPGCG